MKIIKIIFEIEQSQGIIPTFQFAGNPLKNTIS